MTSQIKLLFLEDDEVDRLEFTRLVREQALPYAITTATSLGEARARLDQDRFDVVFTDHRLPDGTAFELFPSREVIGELIVILATGAGDEETAAHALRVGMSGYLVKGVGHDYLRLIPQQIEAALERRQLARNLRESEAKLRDLFDGTSDLIVSSAPDGRLNFVNRAWRETLGYAGDEIADLNLFDLIAPEQRADFRAMLAKQTSAGGSALVETTLLAKTGSIVHVQGRLDARVEGGRVASLRIFFRDVTERVIAELRGRIAKGRLESVLALSTAVIYSCSNLPPFELTFVSGSVEMLLGYSPAEFLRPQFWLDHVHPADRERVIRALAGLVGPGHIAQELTYRFRNAQGEWLWLHNQLRFCAVEPQSQPEIVGVMTDITRQRESDLALRESQARALRLQGALLTMRDYHLEDLRTFFTKVTEAANAALGVTATGIWFGQPDSTALACQDLFSARGGHQGGAQLKVAQLPRFFAALESRSSLACHDVRQDPLAAEIPGSALAGPEVTSLLCAPLYQDRILGLVVFLHEGPPRVWKDEEVKFAVAVAANIMLGVEHAKRLSAEAAAQDLRLHLESLVRERTVDLQESELRFRQLAENITGVFYVVNAEDRRFLYVSPAFEKVWGIAAASLEEHPGLWLDAVDPADRERVREALDQSFLAPVEVEYRVIQPNGSTRWISDRSFPVRNSEGKVYRRTGLASDITLRRESELETMRRQRIETIGTIASGVAHDLNNALAPITLGIHLLRKKHPGENRIISSMQSSAMHGANMVRQLLTFAKGVQGQRIAIEPSALFHEVAVLIHGSFPKNIVLRIHCPDDVRSLLGDPTQLHQVLLNLCVNARDAMPNGGVLELEAANQIVDAAYAAGVPDARQGNYVTLRVKDSGMGISEAIIERIFDPFFTTKGPEKGTGLGLSTAMGIVRSHGGFIRVYSRPGVGTSFVVHVPVAESSSPQPSVPVEREKPLQGNGETILVVDDEPSVREVTAGVLVDLNFRIILACDGTDALIRAAENRTVLRGVITDLHMPHMDGVKVVQALSHMLPGVPIMVASGRIDDQEARELTQLGVVALLHKPFTEDQLIVALRKLMEPPRTALPE